MPRGGARQNSGPDPKWRHGKTQTIRVPIALADQILAMAKKLDEGQPLKIAPRTVDYEALGMDVLKDPLVTRKGKDSGSVKRTIAAFILRLKQIENENA